jgi:hypothetical protein
MTRRARHGASCHVWIIVAIVAGLVAGCAEIPTTGPVERGDQVQGADDEQPLRVLPRGPVPGQSRAEVVKGFLDASASFEDDHAVAKRFLTSRASANWHPDAGVTVIDDNPRRRIQVDGHQATLLADQTAQISPEGAFTPRGGIDITRSFLLRREGDSWRIARVPQGLILDRIEVSLAYRAFDTFYFNPQRTRLVPDPVYLPIEQPGSATSLVQTLLDGPTRWLSPAVKSMIPPGTRLVVESVPVENGVAKVDLSAEFLDADPAALDQAAAQITTTLLELSSSVTGVSISVEGSQLQLASRPTVLTAATWDQYEPDSLTPALGALFVRHGDVRRLDDNQSSSAPGALGKGRYDVQLPSQSWDGTTLTALDQSRTRLYVTHPFVSSDVSKVARGDRLLPATIDGDGRLWLLDTGGKHLRLRVLDGKGWQSAVLRAPRGVITSFRVSIDGTRVAMVVHPKREGANAGRLLVGRVVQGADHLRVEAFGQIDLTLTKVRTASWVDSTTLAILGTSTDSAVEPLLVDINRTVTPLSNDVLVNVSSVVGAPNLPLMADTPHDGIWESSGSGWRFVVKGDDPAYPG